MTAYYAERTGSRFREWEVRASRHAQRQDQRAPAPGQRCGRVIQSARQGPPDPHECRSPRLRRYTKALRVIAEYRLRNMRIVSSHVRSLYFVLSHPAPFVAHFYPWEAKTKAEKKQRRHRNPSLNRNPAASAKGSSQPRRRSRAPIQRPLPARHPMRKGPPARKGLFCARKHQIGQPHCRIQSSSA
jgi:hypothetical protein